jgi:hypothetical protein
MKKSVIILGKGDGWEDAPFYYDDNKVQTWGINSHIMSRPFDIIFEPHDVEWWLENCDKIRTWHKPDHQYRRHIDRVNEMEIPYLTLKHYPFIPTSKAYPVEDICREFGVDYFTGGIDYMLAYAIYKKFDKIDIYGVHTVYDDEYDYQKPSLEFWIGVAIGRGIKITVHGSHSLLRPIYKGKIHDNEGNNPDGLRYGYFVKPIIEQR